MINNCTILILFLTILGCNHKEEPKSLKSNNLVAEKIKKQSCEQMIGRWEYKENDKDHSYTLTIKSDKNGYSANYCFVTGANGEKIDCPEESVICKCKEDILAVNFYSDFEEKLISCNLKLTKNILKLKTTSSPGTSFFLEEMDFVKIK